MLLFLKGSLREHHLHKRRQKSSKEEGREETLKTRMQTQTATRSNHTRNFNKEVVRK